MKYVLTIVLLFLLIHPSFAQKGKTFIDSVEQTVANIKEELIKIKDDYYIIQPEGFAGNIGVYIGTDEIILVDDQWSKLVPRIMELLKTVTSKPVKYVINTHYHFDHVDGNKDIGQQGITIIAHKNLRARLSEEQTISGTWFGPIVQKAYPFEGLPTIVFNDSIEIDDSKESISIIHFPNAHTDGDAIIHFKNANIYHTGDIFVTYGLPVIDEDNGGDIYGMIRTVDYLLSVSNNETRFIPGHGPLCTIKELTAYRNLLTSIKDQVVSMTKKGLPLENIIKEVSIDKTVGGVDRSMFIAEVYRMALKHEKISGKKVYVE
jgi:glyoxylase-like metal-dependent hydrolase (beta-lactamase superfamily II)